MSREDQCMLVTCYAKGFSVKPVRRGLVDRAIKAVHDMDGVVCLSIYGPDGHLMYYATKTGSPLDVEGLLQHISVDALT